MAEWPSCKLHWGKNNSVFIASRRTGKGDMAFAPKDSTESVVWIG